MQFHLYIYELINVQGWVKWIIGKILKLAFSSTDAAGNIWKFKYYITGSKKRDRPKHF